MRETRRRVLVLDGDQAAALTIVRSLARRGFAVDVGDCARRFLSTYSRYRGDVVIYPDPKDEVEAFIDFMKKRAASVAYELVIPVTDDTVQPLAAARDEIERHTRLAIAPNDALAAMTDKRATLEIARRLEVPVPAGRTFETADELADAAPALDYPVVIKPHRSISEGARDVRAFLAVRYAHDADELLREARDALAHGAVIVQEYWRGRGVGIEVLVDEGEVVYAFQHERLHEMPLTGGGSSLRRSVRVDETLLDESRRLMREVGWHGVAMIEYKVDDARGRHALMEVNGRFWGSLPLAVAAGADFPAFLAELLLDGRRPEAPPAQVGVLGRKLSREVFWLIEVLRRSDPNPIIEWPHRGRALLELFRIFLPRHHFDVQTLRDVRPGLVDAVRTVREVVHRAAIKLARRRVLSRMRRVRADRSELRRRVGAARAILFLCYGNINRSILAERCVEGRLDGVTIDSAGFHPRTGRPADPRMVEIAAARGVSLEAASSRRVDAAIPPT